VHKVSSNADWEAPAVTRWAALVGYAKRTVLGRRLKVSAVGESLVSRGKSFQSVGARWLKGLLPNSYLSEEKLDDRSHMNSDCVEIIQGSPTTDKPRLQQGMPTTNKPRLQ